MPTSNEELNKNLEREKKERLLQDMQNTVSYDLKLPDETSLFKKVATKIPLLAKFLNHANTTGSVILKAGQEFKAFTNNSATAAASGVFQFGGVALAAFDFVEVPLIYLMSFALNEKVPITLNNNARFLYSGLLLALAIISIAVPAAAPVIALVGATIGLAVGVFSLGKTVYEYYQLNKQNNVIQSQVDAEEGALQLLQQEAADLKEQLNGDMNEMELGVIYSQIDALKKRFDAQKEVVESLKNKQLVVQNKIKDTGMLQIADKSVGVILGALSVVGLVVAAFFPPVGIGIITGVVAAGGVYFVGRITLPLIVSLSTWAFEKIKSSISSTEVTEGLEDRLRPTPTVEQVDNISSTAKALTGLNGKNADLKSVEVEVKDAALVDSSPSGDVEIKPIQSPPQDGLDEVGEKNNISYFTNTK